MTLSSRKNLRLLRTSSRIQSFLNKAYVALNYDMVDLYRLPAKFLDPLRESKSLEREIVHNFSAEEQISTLKFKKRGPLSPQPRSPKGKRFLSNVRVPKIDNRSRVPKIFNESFKGKYMSSTKTVSFDQPSRIGKSVFKARKITDESTEPRSIKISLNFGSIH